MTIGRGGGENEVGGDGGRGYPEGAERLREGLAEMGEV